MPYVHRVTEEPWAPTITSSREYTFRATNSRTLLHFTDAHTHSVLFSQSAFIDIHDNLFKHNITTSLGNLRQYVLSQLGIFNSDPAHIALSLSNNLFHSHWVYDTYEFVFSLSKSRPTLNRFIECLTQPLRIATDHVYTDEHLTWWRKLMYVIKKWIMTVHRC
jgi:hypothetical protein